MQLLQFERVVKERMKHWNNINGYSQYIDDETNEMGCTCPFMSFFVFSKKFKGKICRHLKQFKQELEEKNEKV